MDFAKTGKREALDHQAAEVLAVADDGSFANDICATQEGEIAMMNAWLAKLGK